MLKLIIEVTGLEICRSGGVTVMTFVFTDYEDITLIVIRKSQH